MPKQIKSGLLIRGRFLVLLCILLHLHSAISYIGIRSTAVAWPAWKLLILET